MTASKSGQRVVVSVPDPHGVVSKFIDTQPDGRKGYAVARAVEMAVDAYGYCPVDEMNSVDRVSMARENDHVDFGSVSAPSSRDIGSIFYGKDSYE